MSKKIGEGITSIVTYDTNTKIVSKKIIRMEDRSVRDREIFWLQYLNEKGYNWCPKFWGIDPISKAIYMEYVGERINKNNAPENWEEQLQKILDDLRSEEIQHNDIKPTEVLVKDGKIHVIDFGWATKGTDWSCGQNFDAREKPCHKFHDTEAISRIAKHLE